MNPTDIALMFYVSGAKETFKDYDDKVLEKLAKEISSLSLVINIGAVYSTYSDDELRYAVNSAESWNDGKPLKMLKFTGNHKFSIIISGKTVKENVTTMQLMGIMAYCINRIKGNQLEGMDGFDWLRNGMQI